MLVQLDRQRLTPAIAHIASESLTALEVGDGMNQTSSGADQNEKYDKVYCAPSGSSEDQVT